MRKIPTVLVRDPDDRRYVTNQVTAGCEWVLAGEGVATRKYDGTCVMLDDDGRWWARREVKRGKLPPPAFRAVGHDDVTGKTVGWEPIGQSPFAKFHAEAAEPLVAFGLLTNQPLLPGTFELIGPKINGNPEMAEHHRLERHANAEQLADIELTISGIQRYAAWIAEDGIEGIVWHHPDGRMAKLKGRDIRPVSPAPEPLDPQATPGAG